MTTSAAKAALRREVVARVAALDPAARLREEARLAARFAALPGWERAGTILVHVAAFADEVATLPLLRRALAAGKRVACPRVDPRRRQLDLVAVVDPTTDLVPGYRGIPEPRDGCLAVRPGEVDWALIPGVAFDRRGYRLGRGGGYYDRLLPLLRDDAPCWALCLAAQWVAAVPREPHDRPLDGVADADSAWPGARSRSFRGP